MKKLILLLIITCLIFSCKKDEEPNDTTSEFTAAHGGVYISNEGNFQSSNSSISYYNPADKTFYEDIFKTVNNRSLGDICQSMNIINGKLYLVINNSGKIEACDPYTMKNEFTITGLISPRYIISVNTEKAYISDGYANQLSILNLTTKKITNTISIEGWTEQMLLKNNKVYVTNMSSEYLYVVDAVSDLVSDSIHISKGANSILEDADGNLRVLCTGDYYHTYNGALYSIDPSNKQILSNFSFNPDEYPSHLNKNATGETIYYLNGALCKMGIHDVSLQPSFIDGPPAGFYGLGIDKSRNEIYLTDPIDYIQKGQIERYNSTGTKLHNFTAGIIPGDFLFIP